MQRDVFHFKTVEVPYDVARRFMRDDPSRIFTPALDGGAGDCEQIAGSIEIDVDGIVMGAEVTLEIGEFEEIVTPLPLAKRRIGWHASEHEAIFPILVGELEAFPIDDGRTQVTFTCHYRPPLSAVGAIADRVYLHRVAEGCLDRFFERLIASLIDAASELSRSHDPGA